MSKRPLREVALLFAKLGLIGFGGPAAHIAMMRDEVVVRRRWIDERSFLDLVAACNLIPGPTSTELAIHLGRRRAGVAGLIAGGLAFVAPAAAIMLGLAWVYTRYGSTPTGDDLLWGVSAAVCAVILGALTGFARTALTRARTVAVAAGSFVAYLLGVNELVILGLAAVIVAGLPKTTPSVAPVFALGVTAIAVDATLWRIGAEFLKIGALLFGSGYVLIAFLRTDLVTSLGWLTEQQLLDAVAVGQMTPGPVFTTATFVGYLLAGFTGAAVATVAIFLPSFVLVALTGPVVERIRASRRAGAALDGVNAGVVGLLAGVLVVLVQDALIDPAAAVLAIAPAIVVLRWRVNNAWIVAAGAVAGLLRTLLS